MSRTSNHSSSIIEQAKFLAKSATTLRELRRSQSILLPALLGATIPQTAAALGIGHATVSRHQATFREGSLPKNATTPRSWGGRRNSWMSYEEEKEFLAPWLAKAQSGTLVVASPIREALAQRLGQAVKASVVYRLLERHDWRKVAPDTRHPKNDPAIQEAWKKNFRLIWKPSSSQNLPRDAG